jgi:MYXO-CTERM domain-containing protein
MYAQSAALVVDIATRQGVPLDRSHIIAHYEVPGCNSPGGGGAGCHTDPGTGWDWDRFMALVNGEVGEAGGEIVGVVADQDIYNGARLIGATVWIEGTDLRTTVADDGHYRFEDVPFGTWTMRASYPGFAEGSCTKSTSSAQDWCSIAMTPSAAPEDTGTAPDTADVVAEPGEGGPGAPLPGTQAKLEEGGLGCAVTPPGPPLGALGILALAALRRRRG